MISGKKGGLDYLSDENNFFRFVRIYVNVGQRSSSNFRVLVNIIRKIVKKLMGLKSWNEHRIFNYELLPSKAVQNLIGNVTWQPDLDSFRG